MEIHDFKKKTRICFCVLSGPPLKILLSSQSWLSWHLGWYVRLVVSPHTRPINLLKTGVKRYFILFSPELLQPCTGASSYKSCSPRTNIHFEEEMSSLSP